MTIACKKVQVTFYNMCVPALIYGLGEPYTYVVKTYIRVLRTEGNEVVLSGAETDDVRTGLEVKRFAACCISYDTESNGGVRLAW